MITHTITRDVSCRSRTRTPISGTMARIGIACSVTMYGKIARSTSFAWLISTAMTMPSTIEMASPMQRHLGARPQRRRGSRRSCPSRGSRSATTSCGGRRRNRRRGVEHDVGDEVPDADDDERRARAAAATDGRASARAAADGGVKLDVAAAASGVGTIGRAGAVGGRVDVGSRRRHHACAPRRACARCSPLSAANVGLEAQVGARGYGERHVELGDDPARAGPTSRAPGCSGTPPR